MDIIKRIREKKFKKSVSKCGKNLNVFGRVSVMCGESIEVGDDLRLNDGVKFFGRKGCSIVVGNDVTISPNSIILCSQYDISKWFSANKKVHIPMDTYIGNHVWICSNVTINGGVNISGEYVVVASGSVVNDDIADSYCLYAGNPARLVKRFNNKDTVADTV